MLLSVLRKLYITILCMVEWAVVNAFWWKLTRGFMFLFSRLDGFCHMLYAVAENWWCNLMLMLQMECPGNSPLPNVR
jgi:hypothetical protein